MVLPELKQLAGQLPDERAGRARTDAVLDIVIDTDPGNEIDDQFAIAWDDDDVLTRAAAMRRWVTPDGRRLAFLSNITGVPQAWVSTTSGLPRPTKSPVHPMSLLCGSPKATENP